MTIGMSNRSKSVKKSNSSKTTVSQDGIQSQIMQLKAIINGLSDGQRAQIKTISTLSALMENMQTYLELQKEQRSLQNLKITQLTEANKLLNDKVNSMETRHKQYTVLFDTKLGREESSKLVADLSQIHQKQISI
jgi:hypothetical protein